ncbi:MAG: hypothetical protein GX783_10785 [Clostridiales bacterium]|nr:hypothetical protein [Clostridiales bacterium]
MRNSKKLIVDGFRIAMAYIGTVIGAGFATGQEILQFFTRYGYSSFWAILISVALFVIVGRSILFYGRELRAKSYGSLIDHVFGISAPLVNLYLAVAYILLCGAMFAGAGALFEEQWGLHYMIGASVTALLTLIVTLRGVKGVLAINTLIVPCLVIFSVSVFVFALNRSNMPVIVMQPVKFGEALSLINTGVTYASFNLVLSIGVLAPLGGEIQDKKALSLGSLLGGSILGLLLIIGNYGLLANVPEVLHWEIPQMVIVNKMGGLFVTLFTLVIWAEIFTTAVGNLFAIHTVAKEKYKAESILPAIAGTVLGLAICLLGFSNIVSWFYPILGIIGFALCIIILVRTFRSES